MTIYMLFICNFGNIKQLLLKLKFTNIDDLYVHDLILYKCVCTDTLIARFSYFLFFGRNMYLDSHFFHI